MYVSTYVYVCIYIYIYIYISAYAHIYAIHTGRPANLRPRSASIVDVLDISQCF